MLYYCQKNLIFFIIAKGCLVRYVKIIIQRIYRNVQKHCMHCKFDRLVSYFLICAGIIVDVYFIIPSEFELYLPVVYVKSAYHFAVYIYNTLRIYKVIVFKRL